MESFRKALSLYWGVYALDFVSSALFISLGYGFAESNQAQRALVGAPSLATLVPWAMNQDIWIAIGTLGAAAMVLSPSLAREARLAPMLFFLSAVRLYGAASNVGFTLLATLGVPATPEVCYALMLVPLGFAFRSELDAGRRAVWSLLPRPKALGPSVGK